MSYDMDRCPVYAVSSHNHDKDSEASDGPFFGAMGCALAMVLTALGASYGMAKSGIGIMATGVLRPDRVMQNTLPPVMASVVSIYGLVIAVIISNALKEKLALYTGLLQLGAGISVGVSGLATGFAIGIVGDAGVRGSSQQPRLFSGMIMILIMAEVLGLYGMIVGLLMLARSTTDVTVCH